MGERGGRSKNGSTSMEYCEQRKEKMEGNKQGYEREEWERYFREMSGSVERKVRREKVRRELRVEEGLEKAEIRRAIGSLKDGKAIGIDGVSGEIWKYGGEKLIE